MIAALMLAAGEAARMGELKQLLPVGRRPLVAVAVAPYLRAPAVDRVVVVVGCRGDEVARALPADPRLTVVSNRRWRLGMASSIRCGVRALGGAPEAILLGLGDQPRIPVSVIERIVARYRAAAPRPLVIIPTFQGRRGHPVLFAGSLAPRLLRLHGDQGARGLIRGLPDGVVEAPVRTRAILHDVDTPEEYASLLSRRLRRSPPRI